MLISKKKYSLLDAHIKKINGVFILYVTHPGDEGLSSEVGQDSPPGMGLYGLSSLVVRLYCLSVVVDAC